MESNLEKYEKKLKTYYDEEGKLLQYPSKRPMRMIALVKIAENFQLGRDYTEKEVNQIIQNQIAFTDIEMIRREMFQYKILGRVRDGSKYWLEESYRKEYEQM